ncbi:hypothetical protein AB0383_43890 [Amycolatopsis sp. NPDC051373]|uniref:hypothetical protein n=1 Tax=Amycolatopsis sp. NPDC051373 TaxID=3155801 RepID=UPI00344E0DF3
MLAAVLAANTEPDRFAAMAPVIMSTPARPELGEELKNSFCRSQDAIAPQARRADHPPTARRERAGDARRDGPLPPPQRPRYTTAVITAFVDG